MMKKVGKVLIGIVEVIIVCYTIIITSCLLFVNEFGYTQLGNYTIIQANEAEGKLLENVNKGDLLIIKNTKDVQINEVVYYYSVAKEQYFVKSAPIKEIKKDDYGALYTLDLKGVGDTNTINQKKLIGSKITIFRKLGKVLDVLESRVGFLFLVLLPIMVIFIFHIYDFVIVLKYEKPDEEDSKEEKTEESKE